jgi:lysophospholipase L1-like esterase
VIAYLRTGPQIFTNVALVILSLTFALLLGEWVVQVVAPQQLSIPLGATVNGIISQRPNIHGRYAVPGVFDTTVTINSQRLRAETEYGLEPSAGVTRIAMLGDSFTFGIGANNPETYPAYLEQVLANASGTARFEVINAGVGGTGTGDQVRHFDFLVKHFHPHLVVLTVISNDVDDDLDRGLFVLDSNGKVRPRTLEDLTADDHRAQTTRDFTSILPGYGYLCQHSALVNLVRDAVNETLVAHRRSLAFRAAPIQQKENLRDRYRLYGLPLLAGEVLWLQETVQATGARLVVIFVPQREAVYSSAARWTEEVRWKTDAISQSLRRLCLQKRIPFLDLTSSLQETAEHASSPIYYEGRDTHPTPAGYRFIAEEVARFLMINRAV